MGHKASVAPHRPIIGSPSTASAGAVDTIVQFQFDRHGAQDRGSQTRRRCSTTSMPTAAGRRRSRSRSAPAPNRPTSRPAVDACPFRFRCLGCGHFRTDPSYLPELRDYLETLLRDRERIWPRPSLDEWAPTEATPLRGRDHPAASADPPRRDTTWTALDGRRTPSRSSEADADRAQDPPDCAPGHAHHGIRQRPTRTCDWSAKRDSTTHGPL